MEINTVWANIVKHEGETFRTVNNIEFVYSLTDENTIMPRNVYKSKLLPIKKDTIETILNRHLPLSSPSKLNNVCFAPSYVFAILTDERII